MSSIRRGLGFVAATLFAAMVLTPVAASADGATIANCPTPSFGKAMQSNAGGQDVPGNNADTRDPGRTVVISYSDPGHRYVTYTGDFMPDSTVRYEYIDTNSHAVAFVHNVFARGNGVPRQESEVEFIPYGPGARFDIGIEYTDECNGLRLGFIFGSLEVVS